MTERFLQLDGERLQLMPKVVLWERLSRTDSVLADCWGFFPLAISPDCLGSESVRRCLVCFAVFFGISYLASTPDPFGLSQAVCSQTANHGSIWDSALGRPDASFGSARGPRVRRVPRLAACRANDPVETASRTIVPDSGASTG